MYIIYSDNTILKLHEVKNDAAESISYTSGLKFMDIE